MFVSPGSKQHYTQERTSVLPLCVRLARVESSLEMNRVASRLVSPKQARSGQIKNQTQRQPVTTYYADLVTSNRSTHCIVLEQLLLLYLVLQKRSTLSLGDSSPMVCRKRVFILRDTLDVLLHRLLSNTLPVRVQAHHSACYYRSAWQACLVSACSPTAVVSNTYILMSYHITYAEEGVCMAAVLEHEKHARVSHGI